MKIDVAPSRDQPWKFHVSPASTGGKARSTRTDITPAPPLEATWFTKRTIEPPTHRLPEDPPGFEMKPWVRLVMK